MIFKKAGIYLVKLKIPQAIVKKVKIWILYLKFLAVKCPKYELSISVTVMVEPESVVIFLFTLPETVVIQYKVTNIQVTTNNVKVNKLINQENAIS